MLKKFFSLKKALTTVYISVTYTDADSQMTTNSISKIIFSSILA